jgi:hypothetical protein
VDGDQRQRGNQQLHTVSGTIGGNDGIRTQHMLLFSLIFFRIGYTASRDVANEYSLVTHNAPVKLRAASICFHYTCQRRV